MADNPDSKEGSNNTIAYAWARTSHQASGTSGTSGYISVPKFTDYKDLADAMLSDSPSPSPSMSPSSIKRGMMWDKDIIKKISDLEATISRLHREANEFAEVAKAAKAGEKEKAEANEKLQAMFKQISEKERLNFLLRGVNEKAQKILLESDSFRKQFLDASPRDAFVMSIDIRRSTELMSKARSAEQFADFMTTICGELASLIKENYGIFDKFTGDGVLAFFPEFFSGNDAGFYVVSVADKSHKIFDDIYKQYRKSFISVLTEVGLGIGIDYGPSHLVQIAGGLTVVGVPVVYACRMGGAPVGITLLNQRGYEKISEKLSAYCFFHETDIEIKGEGKTLAYQVQLNGKEYSPSIPPWETTEKYDQ